MSYTYELTDRAWADFKNLDIWLQEEILDEIDNVTSRPFVAPRAFYRHAVHDFVYEFTAVANTTCL